MARSSKPAAPKAPAVTTSDDLGDIPTIDAGAQYAAKPAAQEVEAEAPKEDMYRKVRITIPVGIRIKREWMPAGTHIVEAHQVDTIVEMVDKKKRADMSVFTGNNYLVQRMIDRSLVVTKVDDIDTAIAKKR